MTRSTMGASSAALHRYLDLGGTFAADLYSPYSNQAIGGHALTGRRQHVIATTKFGSVHDPNSTARSIHGCPEYVVRVRRQLRPLRIESAIIEHCGHAWYRRFFRSRRKR